jgi:hypothetical protein
VKDQMLAANAKASIIIIDPDVGLRRVIENACPSPKTNHALSAEMLY